MKQSFSSLENKVSSLENKVLSLETELSFWKSLKETHSNSLVYNLSIKYKNKQPLWIDIQKITLSELLSLDSDPEIESRIETLRNIRYKDRDY